MTQLMDDKRPAAPVAGQRPVTLDLAQAGQSPWLDFISREMLSSGKLADFIRKSGLLGVTSNPAIFQKALSSSGTGYDADISRLFKAGASTFAVYDELTVKDIQDACDLFAGVYQSSGGEHGFVSLEVDPGLADDEDATVREARRLHKKVNRPNVMIKVPATQAGVRAFRSLTGLGISVNVTLMFSVKHYKEVARAYLDGLTDLRARGGKLGEVHSVASVFVSRIDTLLDKRLQDLAARAGDASKKTRLLALRGKAALANSRLIYQEFLKIFGSVEFELLKKDGAWTQKVLWGSTSSKNPEYNDLIYVEPLIGRDTVNTMPLPTLDAFIQHGTVKADSILDGASEAVETVTQLAELGFDLIQVGDDLQAAGTRSFCESFDTLMRTLEKAGFAHRPELAVLANGGFVQSAAKSVSEDLHVTQAVEKAQKENYLARFLKKDPSLWKGESAHQAVIQNRLGWIYSADWVLGRLHEADRLAADLQQEGVQSLVLLGMGGSSLAPEVMNLVCKKLPGRHLTFYVLDTTDPGSIFAVEKEIKLAKSVFVVASKSGGTVETVSQYQYFYAKVLALYKKESNPEACAGRHFVAITDSGSGLEKLAAAKKFRSVFINPADIGGRFSALSFFGLVPAVLSGVPARGLIKSALDLLSRTIGEASVTKNEALYVGCALGALAKHGKNKLTLWTSKRLAPVGAWLEQLIAESTGKEGEGILPVDGEAPLKTTAYGDDRVFVVLTLKGDSCGHLKAPLAAVKKAGFPLIEMEWNNDLQLGAEMLRWEIITSIACAAMGVNPFDEPNVKESKDLTGQFLNLLESGGKLLDPAGTFKIGSGFPGSARAKQAAVAKVQEWLGSPVSRKGAYLALLTYAARSPEINAEIQTLRTALAETLGIPVACGFGPRYLHSIGQLYKGGPRSGRFIVFLTEEAKDAAVPGQHYRFGQLKKAQALGDLNALSSKSLPVLSVQLGKNHAVSIAKFAKFLLASLEPVKKRAQK